MCLLLSTDESRGSHEWHRSRKDVDPMVGLAVRSRALQARGAALPLRAPPDCAERLARVGVSLVTGGLVPAMLAGGWR